MQAGKISHKSKLNYQNCFKLPTKFDTGVNQYPPYDTYESMVECRISSYELYLWSAILMVGFILYVLFVT